MHASVSGTRPGKSAKGRKKGGAADPGVKKWSRAEKLRKLRATARERRIAAILERYGIPYDPEPPEVVGFTLPGDVVGSTLPGDEKQKGYRRRKKKNQASGG